MPFTILNVSDAWAYTAEADNLIRVTGELTRRGHRVVVACTEGTQLFSRAKQEGYDVRGIAGLRGRNPLEIARAVRGLRALVRAADPDVVHAYRSPPHVAAALALGKRARARLVRTRGTMDAPKRSPMNRFLYGARTAATIVTAAAVREQCAAIGLDPSRIEIIYGGIELDRYDPAAHPRDVARRDLAPLGVGADTPLVVHVARLSEVKGHAYVVAAAREVAAAVPGVRFLLVGPAWPGFDARVRAMIDEAGVAKTVSWIGKVEDVARVLGAADVGLVASVGSEALSRVALEYMAMGVPTVATRVGSLPELVEDGRTGLLVPPRDAAALASAITGLLRDRARRESLGAASRSRAVERFGAPAQVDRLEAVYARVLGPSLSGSLTPEA